MKTILLSMILCLIFSFVIGQGILEPVEETGYDIPMPLPYEGNPIIDLLIGILGGSTVGVTYIGLIHQITEWIHDKGILKKVNNFWIVSIIGTALLPILAFVGGFDCQTIINYLPGKFQYMNIECNTPMFYIACAFLGFLSSCGAIVFDQPIQAKRIRDKAPDKWKGGIFGWLTNFIGRNILKLKR